MLEQYLHSTMRLNGVAINELNARTVYSLRCYVSSWSRIVRAVPWRRLEDKEKYLIFPQAVLIPELGTDCLAT
jgi:hypothetical protein